MSFVHSSYRVTFSYGTNIFLMLKCCINNSIYTKKKKKNLKFFSSLHESFFSIRHGLMTDFGVNKPSIISFSTPQRSSFQFIFLAWKSLQPCVLREEENYKGDGDTSQKGEGSPHYRKTSLSRRQKTSPKGEPLLANSYWSSCGH